MASMNLTFSAAQMQAFNKARRDAGAATLEQYITDVVADQAVDTKVISKFAKRNNKAKQDADKEAKIASDKAKEAFRKKQRAAKDKKK